jgi:hypothetical protein
MTEKGHIVPSSTSSAGKLPNNRLLASAQQPTNTPLEALYHVGLQRNRTVTGHSRLSSRCSVLRYLTA